MPYRLTRSARRDLFEIWSYIASDNEPAADRFIDMLLERVRVLASNPYARLERPEIRSGYRSLAVGAYIIFYRVAVDHVAIVHVIHGRRDLGRYPFDE
jgi:toxin ParE1/3/4